MKTLIIPDIHNAIGIADKILGLESYDRVVFLGDYFDNFHDTPAHSIRVAEWVKESLWRPNRIHLFGNHDIGYAFADNIHAKCSGWTPEKWRVINSLLKKEDWARFKFFHIEQGWLLSHAGFSNHYIPSHWKKITVNSAEKYLTKESELSLKCLQTRNEEHWFYRYGDSRTLMPRGVLSGGLLWSDFDNEFAPVKGLSQVFGHTVSRCPRSLIDHTFEDVEGLKIPVGKSLGVCLDTQLRNYGIIENGVLWVKKVAV